MKRKPVTKIKFLLFIALVACFSLKAETGYPRTDFRIVGYYSLRSAMNNPNSFPFKRLSHINLFFLNPDSTGNFTQDYSSLKQFIDKAHKKGNKVLFSIAGGSKHPYYHTLLRDENRSLFVRNLVDQVLRYDLDGIDVDIEGTDLDENYENFVVELREALKEHQKLITAAVAVYFKDLFTDKALSQFDFINIMVYDRTGPWTPQKPGQHSSFTDAVDDLNYFGNERNIPKEKMVLGVPFYGYGFGPDTTYRPRTMNYNQIISTFQGAEKFDEWIMDDGMIMYYNGIQTITKKTELARIRASGIMIWQIGGDSRGSKSLLKAINKEAFKGKR